MNTQNKSRFRNQGRVSRFLIFIICLGLSVSASAEPQYEQRLFSMLERIQTGNLHDALSEAHLFQLDYPESRLGKMIYADLLIASTTPLTDYWEQWSEKFPKQINALKLELEQRWRANDNPPAQAGLVPSNLLEIGANEHVLLFEVNQSRIYVFENNQGVPELVADYYMSSGLKGAGKQVEGDQRTPLGVYRVLSRINKTDLADLYGEGAYPINYPNVIDQQHGRTGYGIWIHGSPSDTYNRPPFSSNGCLVLGNSDLVLLQDTLRQHNGVPVIIAESMSWSTAEQTEQEKQDFLKYFEQWRQDLAGSEVEAYLSHYSSTDFTYGALLNNDFEDWSRLNKQAANTSVDSSEVQLFDLDIFKYPGEKDTLIVSFVESYDNGLSEGSRKEQYWRKQSDGRWLIIYEGDDHFDIAKR